MWRNFSKPIQFYRKLTNFFIWLGYLVDCVMEFTVRNLFEAVNQITLYRHAIPETDRLAIKVTYCDSFVSTLFPKNRRTAPMGVRRKLYPQFCLQGFLLFRRLYIVFIKNENVYDFSAQLSVSANNTKRDSQYAFSASFECGMGASSHT